MVQTRLASEVALVNQLGKYIISSGGKRIRPVLVLLSAGAFDYQGQDHIELAAIIEFIHTATLLHDDVVDESEMRRGQDSANALFGNAASVLVGDFLYSRAFEMMVEINSMRIMEILSSATNIIAEGEVLQLMNRHDADTSEEVYLEVIHCKTAKLFEAAAQLGAVISGRKPAEEEAMADYGMHLGTAFQLIDDVLDYTGSEEQIGKNVGDDLAEGKPTLPLIHTIREGTPAQSELIRKAINHGGLDLIDQVLEAIQSTRAIEYAAQLAKQEADKAVQAIAKIPDSEYKEAMLQLAAFSINRQH